MKKHKKYSISVIIPTYRDWKRLKLCVDALSMQNYPSSEFEVIIVNNDPFDFPPMLGLGPNFKIIAESRIGSYAARNAGLAVAKGEIIGFTDSDCIPDSNWINNAISHFKSQKNLDRVTGRVNIFRSQNSSWVAWKLESITAFNQKYNAKNGVAVTANLFVRRKVFDQIGVFDESLFSGGDFAWNRSATEQGVSLLYSENVVVNHPARASMKNVVKKSLRVVGGGYVQSRQKRTTVSFALKQLVPPIRYGMLLIKDGKPITSVLFACSVYWVIKVLMFLEILRLSMGGTPLRQ